jgi:hypothetical protein
MNYNFFRKLDFRKKAQAEIYSFFQPKARIPDIVLFSKQALNTKFSYNYAGGTAQLKLNG